MDYPRWDFFFQFYKKDEPSKKTELNPRIKN